MRYLVLVGQITQFRNEGFKLFPTILGTEPVNKVSYGLLA